MKQKNKLPEPEWRVVSRNTKPKDGYILIHKNNETIQMRMDDDRSMEQRMEEKQNKKAQKKENKRAKKDEKRIAKKQKLLSERYQIDYDEEDEDEDEDEDYDEEYEEEIEYEIEEIFEEEEWEDDMDDDEDDEEYEDEDDWEEETPKERALKRATALGVKKEPIQKGTLYAKVVSGEYAVLTYQQTKRAITYQLYQGLFEEEDFCDLMIEKIPYEIEEEGTVEDESELYQCFYEAYPWFMKKKVEIIPIFSTRWLSRSAHGVIYDIAPFKRREFYHHIQE